MDVYTVLDTTLTKVYPDSSIWDGGTSHSVVGGLLGIKKQYLCWRSSTENTWNPSIPSEDTSVFRTLLKCPNHTYLLKIHPWNESNQDTVLWSQAVWNRGVPLCSQSFWCCDPENLCRARKLIPIKVAVHAGVFLLDSGIWRWCQL